DDDAPVILDVDAEGRVIQVAEAGRECAIPIERMIELAVHVEPADREIVVDRSIIFADEHELAVGLQRRVPALVVAAETDDLMAVAPEARVEASVGVHADD